ALEDPGAAGARHPAGGEDVLDRDRYAVERAQGLPGGAALVGSGSLLEGALGVDVQEGVDGPVHCRDAVEVGPGDLDAGGRPGSQVVGQLRRGAAGQVAHCSSPRIRGTLNRCPSTSGAPDRASSGVSPGTTTSSRKTLVSGSAWEVGGTSSPATPWMEATDSRITESWGARWSSS